MRAIFIGIKKMDKEYYCCQMGRNLQEHGSKTE